MKFTIILSLLISFHSTLFTQPAKVMYSDAMLKKSIDFVTINQHPVLIQIINTENSLSDYLRLMSYDTISDSFKTIFVEPEAENKVFDFKTLNYKDSLLMMWSAQLSCDVIRGSKLTIFDGKNIKRFNTEKLNLHDLFILSSNAKEIKIINLAFGRVEYYSIDLEKGTITLDGKETNTEGLKRTWNYTKIDNYIYCLKESKLIGFKNQNFFKADVSYDIDLQYISKIKRNGLKYLMGYDKMNIYIFDLQLELIETIAVDFAITKHAKNDVNDILFTKEAGFLKGLIIQDTTVQKIERKLNNGIEIDGIYHINNNLIAYGYQHYSRSQNHYRSPRIPFTYKLQNNGPMVVDYDIEISDFTYDSAQVFRSCGGSPASGFFLRLNNVKFDITNHGINPLLSFDLRLNYSSDGHCPRPIFYNQRFKVDLATGELATINLVELELTCTTAFAGNNELCFFAVHQDGKYMDTNADNNSICTKITIPPSGIGTNDINKTSFYINPNPANDFITIKSESLINASYEVINITGRLILEGVITNDKQNVDLARVKSGIYFITITHNGHAVSKKIIVN